jgi:hypothetical protein
MTIGYLTFPLDDYQTKDGNFDSGKYIAAVNKALAGTWEPIAIQYVREEGQFVYHVKAVK